jgi:hypothetical protein
MRVIPLGAFLLLAAVLTAAQDSSAPKSVDSGAPEPKLPVIEPDACPGALVVGWKIGKDVPLYSSWQENRELLSTLKTGDKVNVLAGTNIIREPDRALVTRPSVQPRLEAGDVILRYGINADWNWRFWAKGTWFTEYIDRVVEKSGSCSFVDARSCPFKVVQNGVKEWWVRARTNSGRTGWVLASKYSDPDIWTPGGAFQGLCAEDDKGD